jgi:hypothetical protein
VTLANVIRTERLEVGNRSREAMRRQWNGQPLLLLSDPDPGLVSRRGELDVDDGVFFRKKPAKARETRPLRI